MGKSRHSVIPSANVILQVWQTMLNTAIAMGIDLTETLDEQVLSKIIDTDNEWPDELYLALLKSMATGETSLVDSSLEEPRCVKQLGRVLLEERTQGSTGTMPMALL